MRLFSLSLLAVLLLSGVAQGQFFRDLFTGFGRGVRTAFKPVMHMIHNAPRPSFFSSGGKRPGAFGNQIDHETGGTAKPVATGHDNPFPDDCGRDKEKGTGLLCFPDGKLCQESKFSMAYRQSRNPVT